MHLERGLTTTSTKKRKQKVTKAQQAELERGWRDRNQRLRAIGLAKETFEQYLEWIYGKGKKSSSKTKFSTESSPAVTQTRQIIDKTLKGEPRPKTSVDINSGIQLDESLVQVSKPGRWVTGPCTTKQTPTYTGTKIIGIGTMHKSNAVPIFSDDEAKEISSMRR